MNNARSVSIITRTRNRPALLRRAVDSVLSQTHADWEHVIVNDGGDPAELERVIEPHRERYGSRVNVIHNGTSLGMEAASNIGLERSSGKYVAIHDDDDSWEPAFLARCVGELERCPHACVRGVVTHITQIFERETAGRFFEVRRQDYSPGLTALSLPEMTEINRFLPIAFVYERSVLEDIGLYDESLPVIGDWDFNIRFLMKYDIGVIPEPLANYHVRTQSAENYRNSVTAAAREHRFHRALLVNKTIRADIEAGRITPGQLLACGDYFYRVGGDLSRLGVILDKLKNLGITRVLRKLLRN